MRSNGCSSWSRPHQSCEVDIITPNFADEEMKTQRGKVTFLGSPKEVIEQELTLCSKRLQRSCF